MQKINPVHLDAKKHWKLWLLDAFYIYRNGILTHKAIMLFALSTIYLSTFIKSIIPSGLFEYYDWIHFASFRIIVCAYIITYIIGIAYKYDKSSPSLSIDFSKEKMGRFIRLNMVFFVSGMLFYAIEFLFSINTADSLLEIEYSQIELFLINTSSVIVFLLTDPFSLVKNIL